MNDVIVHTYLNRLRDVTHWDGDNMLFEYGVLKLCHRKPTKGRRLPLELGHDILTYHSSTEWTTWVLSNLNMQRRRWGLVITVQVVGVGIGTGHAAYGGGGTGGQVLSSADVEMVHISVCEGLTTHEVPRYAVWKGCWTRTSGRLHARTVVLTRLKWTNSFHGRDWVRITRLRAVAPSQLPLFLAFMALRGAPSQLLLNVLSRTYTPRGQRTLILEFPANIAYVIPSYISPFTVPWIYSRKEKQGDPGKLHLLKVYYFTRWQEREATLISVRVSGLKFVRIVIGFWVKVYSWCLSQWRFIKVLFYVIFYYYQEI